MLRLIYTAAFYLIMPFVLARLFWRSIREPAYRATLGQRFGFVDVQPGAESRRVWVHAVSAGETIAVAPLVERLIARKFEVLISTMTPTGRQRVQGLFGDRVLHCYAPYDLPDAIERFLDAVDPECLIIVDTELWPNMIHGCHARGVKTMLINGRLSARSANGYRRIGGLSRAMIASLDLIAVQTQAHRTRFVALGASEKALVLTGSIKFDSALPADFESRTAHLKQKVGDRPVIIGASTHGGEETLIVTACRSLREVIPDLLLILAPRHPHRNAEVLRLATDEGENVVLHSTGEDCHADTTVFLVDTMGDLGYFYGVADVAIVGGSLVPIGGHNLMEAVGAGVAVVMGQYLENIDDIASMFTDAGGLQVVHSQVQLQATLEALMTDPSRRQAQVAAANKVLDKNRGALDMVEHLIMSKLNEHA